MSKGEKIIEQYLTEENFSFVKEYVFSDLKYKNSLRCDFYIDKYKTIIEVDGKQHYKKDKKETEEDFQQRLARDKTKDEYAIKHGFKLIRIPYNKLNIITPKYLAKKIKEPKFGRVYNLSNLISVGPYYI